MIQKEGTGEKDRLNVLGTRKIRATTLPDFSLIRLFKRQKNHKFQIGLLGSLFLFFKNSGCLWIPASDTCSFTISPVDVRLPFQAEMFIQNVILVFFCVGIIAGVFPWFLVAVGPLVILFSILHIVSR